VIVAGKRSADEARLTDLIPDSTPDDAPAGLVRLIPIEEIRPNRNQPRKTFEPKALADLVASIRANGIIQPLLAQEVGGAYELIAGERRFRAACMAGLREVPTIIRTVERESDALELALIENLQREDLSPIEEAEAYLKLSEEFGYTQDVLSRKLGKGRATVANVMRLLKLPPEVQEAIATGAVSAGHGKALLALDDADVIRDIFQVVLERELNVRQTEQIVRRILATPATPPKPAAPAEPASWVEPLVKRLGSHLGTRVDIVQRKGGRGRLVLDYSDAEDLNRIIEIIERRF
jgi:ParB family transcriptional regulator, chromosome partitioning protein